MKHDRNRTTALRAAFAALCLLVTAIGACSPGPMPIARSPEDPSSPLAPEGVSPMLAASEPAPAPATHEHPAHGAGDVVYTCPMHPEVTSSTPGVCPKCKMKLVPKD